MSLTNEDLIAISQLLDTKMVDIATKQDIVDMVTNNTLDKRLNNTENMILEEVDRVQIKSNDHYNDIVGQLKMANSAINTIKIENSTVNILLKSMSDLQNEVNILKERLDKVS